MSHPFRLWGRHLALGRWANTFLPFRKGQRNLVSKVKTIRERVECFKWSEPNFIRVWGLKFGMAKLNWEYVDIC